MPKKSGKKTPEQLVKDAEKRSFAEEIERDKQQSEMLIRRGEQANQDLIKLGHNNTVLEQEIESVAVYKRALVMLGSANMQVIAEDGTSTQASENNMPVSSYLSHGSRTVIQISAGSGNELINWLTSGNPDKNGISTSQDPDKAMKEGMYVYNRSAATHDVSVKKDQFGKERVVEEKGFTIGLRDFLANKLFGRKAKHSGVDLAVGAELGGVDDEGRVVTKPDGDHGHLYIHYTPATKTSPGSIMIGLEAAAPRSSKHSKVGASDPISASGGSKFDELVLKHGLAGEKEYSKTVVPKKYNGLYADPGKEKISEIVKLKDTDFGTELAKAKPANSPQGFVANKGESHAKPDYQQTKSVATPKKPSIWHRIANKVTFGYAYKTELKEYKEAKKLLNIQHHIGSRDQERMMNQFKSKPSGISKEVMPEVNKDLTKTLQKNVTHNTGKTMRSSPANKKTGPRSHTIQ